jgi:two-component system, cell cycle response regulator DivK
MARSGESLHSASMIPQPHSPPATPRLILFVDPDVDTHDLYRTFLVPRRYIVQHVDDGRFALARALADPPDVVVTEARVPGIDGIALCGLLRKDPTTRWVPVVVLTGDPRPQLHQQAYRAGATRVLVKPCLPEVLLEELQQVSARADATEEWPVTEPPIGRRSRTHQRLVTTAPPVCPPILRCPHCDVLLVYRRSQIGGVSAKFPEQWDYYQCPGGCGEFQYRHRTRKVSASGRLTR